MKKNYMITIKGTQKTGEGADTIELLTVGSMYRKNNSYYIRYEESAATGYEGCTTVVKVDNPARVSMTRYGASRAALTIEKGVRHLCHYGSEFGDFTVGVYADKVLSSLGEKGGDLHFSYTLDINSSFASENEVHINVREC